MYHFQVSQPTVARIFIAWINFLFVKFKEIPIWPSWKAVNEFIPVSLHTPYPKTRCITDNSTTVTFSSYKNRNTLKALIAITPTGAICFVSDLYSGNISDKK